MKAFCSQSNNTIACENLFETYYNDDQLLIKLHILRDDEHITEDPIEVSSHAEFIDDLSIDGGADLASLDFS